jgi:hypothetical protein
MPGLQWTVEPSGACTTECRSPLNALFVLNTWASCHWIIAATVVKAIPGAMLQSSVADFLFLLVSLVSH